jgi:hypothetical protein
VKRGPHGCGDLKLCAIDLSFIDFKVSLRNKKKRILLPFKCSEPELWVSQWQDIQSFICEAFELSQGSRLVLSVVWDQDEIVM